MGYPKAMKLLAQGEVMSADEAHSCGLITSVIKSKDQFMQLILEDLGKINVKVRNGVTLPVNAAKFFSFQGFLAAKELIRGSEREELLLASQREMKALKKSVLSLMQRSKL